MTNDDGGRTEEKAPVGLFGLEISQPSALCFFRLPRHQWTHSHYPLNRTETDETTEKDVILAWHLAPAYLSTILDQRHSTFDPAPLANHQHNNDCLPELLRHVVVMID